MKKKYPSILAIQNLVDMLKVTYCRVEVEGRVQWVPRRPAGFPSFAHRCKAAWLVFRGRADALVWQGGQ